LVQHPCLQDALSAGAEVPVAATGVYVGCVWQEYQLLLEQLAVPPSVSVFTGSGMNFLIGRVSYTFGLQGVASLPMALCADCAGSHAIVRELQPRLT
jgi:acyl transferase domain-containing protein